MQKIVLFIEPFDEAFFTPLKIGNSFLNRLAVDEDAASEILKIFELEKTSFKLADPKMSEERKQKGKDLNNKINRLNCFSIMYKMKFASLNFLQMLPYEKIPSGGVSVLYLK